MKVHELFEAEERSILSIMGKQPERVDGTFYCSEADFTSLEGAPHSVGGNFFAYSNKLTSLKGAPTSVGGNCYFNGNKLISLEGAPSSIGGQLYCTSNKLTSLHNIHKQIKHIGVLANFEFNPIKSHVLGLLLIDGLKTIILDNREVAKIIIKHLKGDRDIFACQEELIEDGFEEYAQL